MAVAPVSSVSSVANNTASSEASASANLDYNSFLKLLIAQMKNQDPTDPMDASEQVAAGDLLPGRADDPDQYKPGKPDRRLGADQCLRLCRQDPDKRGWRVVRHRRFGQDLQRLARRHHGRRHRDSDHRWRHGYRPGEHGHGHRHRHIDLIGVRCYCLRSVA